MNNIEEKLWDYIDGNCSAEEEKTISSLIASDEAYRLKYQDLLNLNKEISGISLDEPPMAFTYNVIEAIRTEQARQPLKAAVNNRIIRSIGAFFVLTLVALLVYTFANVSWSSVHVPSEIPSNLKLPDTSGFFTRPVIQGFFFFDVILGLFLFDSYLRRKKTEKHV
jgi:hypothetical protein